MYTMGSKSKDLLEALCRMQKSFSNFSLLYGMSKSAFFILRSIEMCIEEKEINHQELAPIDGVKISDISTMLEITKPAVSQMIGSLEEKGIVKRMMDVHDRRVVFVCLTPKGKEILTEAKKSVLEKMDAVIESFGHSDTEMLIDILNRLHATLEIKK